MALITVVGPLTTEQAAQETAQFMGIKSHSVYSRTVRDAEGYDTDDRQWFVERDTDIVENLFGYDTAQFISRQYK